MKKTILLALSLTLIPIYLLAEDIPSYNSGTKPVSTHLVTLFSGYSSTGNGTSGAGVTKRLDFVACHHTWQTIITGTATSTSLSLQGSIDDTNWFSLDTSTSNTSEMRSVADKCVNSIRGKLTTFTNNTAVVTIKSIHRE